MIESEFFPIRGYEWGQDLRVASCFVRLEGNPAILQDAGSSAESPHLILRMHRVCVSFTTVFHFKYVPIHISVSAQGFFNQPDEHQTVPWPESYHLASAPKAQIHPNP